MTDNSVQCDINVRSLRLHFSLSYVKIYSLGEENLVVTKLN